MLTLSQVERNRRAFQEIRTELIKAITGNKKTRKVTQLHSDLPDHWEKFLHLALIGPALLDSLQASQSIIEQFVLPDLDSDDPKLSAEENAVYEEAFRVVGQSKHLLLEAQSRQKSASDGSN